MKKRERYLDVAKGLAILCIVLLHVENGVIPGGLNTFIGSFMISMFFVTTGWLDGYRSEPLGLKELCRKRWKQLGVPYLWWTGIILAFDLVLWAVGYYDAYMIGREAYKALVLRGIGTLWFLPALFGGEIIWNLVRRRGSVIVGLLAVAATLAAQYAYAYAFGGKTDSLTRIIEAPLHTLNNMLAAWTSIAAGFLFRRFFVALKMEGMARWRYLVAGTVVTAAGYWCANYWPVPMLWGLAAPVVGPIGIMLLAMAADDMRITDYFNYWGLNSLALMVTHYSIVMVLFEMLNKAILHEPYIQGYPAFAYFVAIMIVEYFICELITRKCPRLLGK